MSNQKHTPGPWTCTVHGRFLRGTGTILVNSGESTVAEIPVSIHGIPFPKETEEANARLITASPDLLAACEAAQNYIDSDDMTLKTRDKVMALIESAIAKAKGGAA